jgi:predicted component of type VI protein secretion system
MPYLRFIQDDGTPSEVPIDAENSIVRVGRATDCHIITRNSTVSRKHCQIVFTGSGYKLTDLKSSNGTFFNRERIEEHDLNLGDTFLCGNFEIQFLAESMFAAAPLEEAASEPMAEGDDGLMGRIEALEHENAALQAQLGDLIASNAGVDASAQVATKKSRHPASARRRLTSTAPRP